MNGIPISASPFREIEIPSCVRAMPSLRNASPENGQLCCLPSPRIPPTEADGFPAQGLPAESAGLFGDKVHLYWHSDIPSLPSRTLSSHKWRFGQAHGRPTIPGCLFSRCVDLVPFPWNNHRVDELFIFGRGMRMCVA